MCTQRAPSVRSEGCDFVHRDTRAHEAMVGLRPEHWRAFSYVMLNMVSATGIVFANKLVLSVLDFHFVRPGKQPCFSQACRAFVVAAGALTALLCPPQVYALTFVHSAFTMVGMWLFAAVGMFEVKRLAARQARRPPLQTWNCVLVA